MNRLLSTLLLLLISKARAFTVTPRRTTSLITSSLSTGTSRTIQDLQQEPKLLDPATVSQRVFATDRRPIILFDGVCNLCNGAVNLALDWDPEGKLRFAALQSHVGRALLQNAGRRADDISSIVLVTQKGAFVKSDAILFITQELQPSWLPLPLAKPAAQLGLNVVPRFLRDLIYDGVADNRYQILGKRDSCRFDTDGEFESRFVDDTLAIEEE